MQDVIQSLLLSAAALRPTLKRPSPDLYALPTKGSLTKLFAAYSDDDLREGVRVLSRAKVHPMTQRDSLIETLVTHFQHMVNHRVNPVTGKPYHP
jgi:hypothetical protein